jgi:hypothetical protein
VDDIIFKFFPADIRRLNTRRYTQIMLHNQRTDQRHLREKSNRDEPDRGKFYLMAFILPIASSAKATASA